jgi:hypothetical protein
VTKFTKHTFKINDKKCDVYGWKKLESTFIETIDSVENTYSKYPLIIDATNKSDYQLKKETIVPFKKMNTISISGVECVLSEISPSSSSYFYPQVCVRGYPLTSIEFIYDEIQLDSLKRAEIVVDSFISYEQKLCSIPDDLLSPMIPFSIDLINSFTAIDTHDLFGKKYLIIEGVDINKAWFKFIVFDKNTCISILKKHYENKKNDSHKFWVEDFWQITFSS